MLTMLPSPEALWKSLRGSLPAPFRPLTEEEHGQQVVRETKTHSYVLDKQHQIGLGGFSNVYAAQLKKRTPLRNRLSISALRKKLGHGVEEEESSSAGLSAYEFAIKVCELNAEKVAVPTVDEYGLPLDPFDMPPQMAVAELEMLVEETHILKSLQPSRYVVKLHDCFILTTSQQFWMVMERLVVDMESIFTTDLFDQIPNARASFLKQTLDGLAYLKASRIVHGDIKPSNLLLSSTGFVKICDFGIAKKVDEGEKLKVEKTKGSPPYMAPELWVEGFEYDFAVDLFAFGCVAYASINKGKSPLGRAPNPDSHMFRIGHWREWQKSNTHYFELILGTKFLSQTEREQMYKQSDLLFKENMFLSPQNEERRLQERVESEQIFYKFYKKNITLIQTIRCCVIPMPANGPNGEVTRTDLLYRKNLEELQELKYFEDAPGELASRNSLMKVVQALQRRAAKKALKHTQEPSL